jgi:hypothetical protein
MSKNADSEYLLYQIWERTGPNGKIICGSYLYDVLIQTEDEAKLELERAKKNDLELSLQLPALYEVEDTRRFVYIKNELRWWK